MEYVEVGLIVGDDPEKHTLKGKSKPKGKGKQTDNIVLRRDKNAMRVFIPVSEKANSQAKFFMGCRYAAGCNP
ncbi:hypothetical protein HYE67_005619 [Fusarium culmorum]|uniref:Uncharacterized protein n=1 Tax=Fusarium culmorum TaxID=5516 RepID=A0A7S8D7E6_FUSCU|nr:hypothetical protein HYE67_005619 [Fusarium culmorum]